MNNRKKVSVNIYGDEYVMIGVDEEEYIQNIAKEVDMYMHDIAKSNNKYNKTMIAVLTALNLLDTMRKAEERSDTLEKENELLKKIAERPIKDLENANNELFVIKKQYNKLQSEMNQNRIEVGILTRELEQTKEKLTNSNYEVDISKENIEELQGRLFENQIEILKMKKELDSKGSNYQKANKQGNKQNNVKQ